MMVKNAMMWFHYVTLSASLLLIYKRIQVSLNVNVATPDLQGLKTLSGNV